MFMFYYCEKGVKTFYATCRDVFYYSYFAIEQKDINSYLCTYTFHYIRQLTIILKSQRSIFIYIWDIYTENKLTKLSHE